VIIISSNNSRFRLGSVRQLAAIVLTVGACLAIPAMASAQTVDPTDSQYGNVVQQVSSGGSACQDNSGCRGYRRFELRSASIQLRIELWVGVRHRFIQLLA